MSILHHPDGATLMSYAAGSLPEALSAVVAVHMALCQKCAREARALDGVGAALLEAMKPSTLLRETPRPPAAETPPVGPSSSRKEPAPASTLPAPLVKLVGAGSLDQIRWKRLGPGVWHRPLALSPGAKGDLRLIKVAPGRVLPDHGHGGSELTLVLEGAYKDKVGTFRSGDLADLDEETEHQPVADAAVGCICLIASTEKARFKGVLARLVQPLTGM